jgi:hypothetical protein
MTHRPVTELLCSFHLFLLLFPISYKLLIALFATLTISCAFGGGWAPAVLSDTGGTKTFIIFSGADLAPQAL